MHGDSIWNGKAQLNCVIADIRRTGKKGRNNRISSEKRKMIITGGRRSLENRRGAECKVGGVKMSGQARGKTKQERSG